jgi:hypothetical protein
VISSCKITGNLKKLGPEVVIVIDHPKMKLFEHPPE